MTQLDLDGRPSLVPPCVRLTTRQRIALEYVAEHGPVSNDEVGAALHAYRMDKGGRGHRTESRCDYCADEGKAMLRRLAQLGLVKRKRGVGWLSTRPTSRGLQTDEVPF